MSMNRCSNCPGWADASFLRDHRGYCPTCFNAICNRIDSKLEPFPIRFSEHLKEQKRKVKAMNKPKHRISIIIDGGLIQDIENIPKDTTIEVRDYNTEGADIVEDGLIQDEDGKWYSLALWP